MNKPATVIISGRPPGQNLVDIEIPPGSTALDVLTAVGLDRNWTLSRENSNQVWAAEEEVYAAIDPGAKLRASPLSEVGQTDWLTFLLKLLGLAPAPQVRVGQPRGVPATPHPTPRLTGSAHRQHVAVTRDQRSLWEVRGWRREGNKLLGAYRLGRRGAFAGEIDLSNPYRPDFFITAPPESVLTGSHGACFRRRKGNTYGVHFGIASPEVDAGITAIEKLLAASL